MVLPSQDPFLSFSLPDLKSSTISAACFAEIGPQPHLSCNHFLTASGDMSYPFKVKIEKVSIIANLSSYFYLDVKRKVYLLI
jgi:hypothetical protein